MTKGDWLDEADRFYLKHGPCCAGCDHWRALSTRIPSNGNCTKDAPGPRIHLPPGWDWCSRWEMYSEYPFTDHNHKCADFQDTFDWSKVSGGELLYRKMKRSTVCSRSGFREHTLPLPCKE